MSGDKIDLGAVDRDAQEVARQQRGWLKRNWLWFVPLLLLVLIVVGGGIAYWAMFTRIYSMDVCRSAMQQIEKDEGLRRELGEPIATDQWPPPAPRLEEGEKDVRWPIVGPKGRAKAHVSARLMLGKWEIVQLEVVLADGKRVSVASAGEGVADAPPYTAPKTETKKPETNAPPPVINLPVPPAEPGK
jgi:hypothetical protein